MKSKIWILIFTVMFFLTGCSFDKNEKIAYYNDETNYIIDEGKIVKIILLDDPSKYSNAYETLLEIDLGENPKYMPHYDGTSIGRFYIVIQKEKGSLSERGWIPQEGDWVVFKTATKLWGGSVNRPIVELYYNNVCYLEFEEGKNGWIAYIEGQY